MTTHNTNTRWKKIMDLCDALSGIKGQSEESALLPAERKHQRATAKKVVSTLEKKMLYEARVGLLAPLFQKEKLSPKALAIIAILLSRYVALKRSELSGREIFDLLLEGSFAKLQAISLLQPEGALRACGILEVVKKSQQTGPLDTYFRLSDRVVEHLCEAGLAESPPKKRTRRRPYRNNREYLLDWKTLKSLYQRRALLLFESDPLALDGRMAAQVRVVEKKLHALRQKMQMALEVTMNASKFSAVHFQNQFNLSEKEMVLVIGLLFQELLEGEAYADAVQLLKMISQDEEDLIRNRKLLQPNAKLLKSQILHLEDMAEGKEMTAEVFLSNWVVERLLEESTKEQAIETDEKIDFHNYLKNLDSAEKFLKDLSGE